MAEFNKMDPKDIPRDNFYIIDSDEVEPKDENRWDYGKLNSRQPRILKIYNSEPGSQLIQPVFDNYFVCIINFKPLSNSILILDVLTKTFRNLPKQKRVL